MRPTHCLLFILTLGLISLPACAAQPSATPDIQATEAAMVAHVLATLTAGAPTVTQTPTVTLTLTQTSTQTSTPTLTPTPTSTSTSIPTPTMTPTNTPIASTNTPVPPTKAPAASVPTLAPALVKVSFINPHYDCDKRGIKRSRSDGTVVEGYRYFQIDLFITNNSSEQVSAPWKPSKWIVTNGSSERAEANSAQWVEGRGASPYPQPNIVPGAIQGWTWIVLGLQRNEWVKAVEYDYAGRTYRQDFDLGAQRNNYNFKASCGY